MCGYVCVLCLVGWWVGGHCGSTEPPSRGEQMVTEPGAPHDCSWHHRSGERVTARMSTEKLQPFQYEFRLVNRYRSLFKSELVYIKQKKNCGQTNPQRIWSDVILHLVFVLCSFLRPCDLYDVASDPSPPPGYTKQTLQSGLQLTVQLTLGFSEELWTRGEKTTDR